VLIVGMFMSILDISIVNVAIPTMQRDFSATTEQIQWVENAYSLALGIVVPVSARPASRFGPGRGLQPVAARLRHRVRALRAGVEPGEHRRLPRAAGAPAACCRS
jgi:MFS family permease